MTRSHHSIYTCVVESPFLEKWTAAPWGERTVYP